MSARSPALITATRFNYHTFVTHRLASIGKITCTHYSHMLQSTHLCKSQTRQRRQDHVHSLQPHASINTPLQHTGSPVSVRSPALITATRFNQHTFITHRIASVGKITCTHYSHKLQSTHLCNSQARQQRQDHLHSLQPHASINMFSSFQCY